MPRIMDIYSAPPELVLGDRLNDRVPEADQSRQRAEVEEILRRLRTQPGVILADEVGMGKTFVALAVAYGVAIRSPRGPVIVMVPANLVDKWEQDLKTFCELYLDNRLAIQRSRATRKELAAPTSLRYDVARHSIELMKLLDDQPRKRCHPHLHHQLLLGRKRSDGVYDTLLNLPAVDRGTRVPGCTCQGVTKAFCHVLELTVGHLSPPDAIRRPRSEYPPEQRNQWPVGVEPTGLDLLEEPQQGIAPELPNIRRWDTRKPIPNPARERAPELTVDQG
jgi:hypothetical protein